MELANHGLILLQQLNAQREFGFLCDCTVAIGDVFFKAHKAVLAAFSNYFRMLFIHQDSDCVRLKPADIQPDIFSYLLNLMYTGKLATQLIDPARLEQGVKFLHAYPLIQEASLSNHATQTHPEVNLPLSSSLYGIQISDQQATLTNRLSARTHLSPPFDLEGGGLIDGKGVTTNKATSLTRPGSKHRHNLTEAEVEASASISQFVREGSEMETSAGEAPSCSLNTNTILHVKPSIMRRNTSLRKHYTCHVCGGRFTQRGTLREHLLLHTQAMLPLVLESAGAASPMATGGAATPEVEEVLRSSEASAATPIIVDAASDSEQHLYLKDSPHPETAMPIPTTTAISLYTAQPQADTPPPSDIADIDNLEGAADMEREVKRRKYECSTCGRKFIQKSHWREHMYIHTGKPYRCSACGKSFCRANQAARHVCMNLSSEPAYTMVDRQSMELCGADDSSQMEALFLGSSVRPYKCNVCEMTFSSPNEVIKHLCFNQGALSGGVAGEMGVSGLNSDNLAKDEGSDSSNGGPLTTPIKTEEVFVE
ncbi:zinc finger and BTB domain-containing protein 2b [Pimephales promelas]|uniref:zinc finger and BTB domain-containing protein 2b n=1 Tax=Pimephales promelas TaxID=90988 RepID=UPI0019559F0C|nr:zinc finger and BTB domain-containing protein 2b [Pimephales promelas]KAG1964436.1 zinc finger and BTB domain-containing protein [Pimephales promelas]KAG1964437.1 zinc finger and BTB domain-containing protein [Pimephales promelas]